jgi:hypothetical protein
MTLGRHRPRKWLGGRALALSAVLLGGCASDRSAARDDNAERIERILRPAHPSEPIPDGIAFVPDAPPPVSPGPAEPLAQAAPSPEPVPEAPGTGGSPVPCTRPPHGAILPAPVPLSCLLNPGAIEYRIAPRPGGSIPGLLP